MVAIELGIATFFDGLFSATEIVLTVLIGGFSTAGIRECIRSRESVITHCLAAVAIGAVVQIAAMCVSFMPAFANR